MSAESEITLDEPITFGDTSYDVVVLREPTTGDVIEAQEASEKVVMTADGPQLVSSPSRMGNEMLARQIVRLVRDEKTYQGPLKVDELKRFSARDFNHLIAESFRIEGAADAEAIHKQSEDRGRGEGVDRTD